jgi:DNA polymerase-1
VAKIYPKSDQVGSLFAGHHEPTGWTAPSELPDFSAYSLEDKFGYDTETTSKNPNIARVVGLAICTPDYKKYYLPVGHRGGGNLDENAVRRWAKANLRGRRLCALNAKYDVQVSRNWGLDLESIDARIHDPAFKAALLDENRRRFNLNMLSQDILGLEKSDSVDEKDKSNIADMAASEVGGYAEHDAFLHMELDLVQQREIDAQELSAVCDLEDQLIYSTVAMESKGARIDRAKLELWVHQVEMAHQASILELHSTTGLKINPNSTKDLTKLFNFYNIPLPKREEELGGGETFEEEYLIRVDHPCVRLVMAARKLHSLLTKYLKKYLKVLDSNNILRYSLHQLRGDEFGTVSGRYASAAPSSGGCNIQQVMKVESQLEEEAIAQWIVRELFIPEDGKIYVSADASQIEFRWFAHYSKAVTLIKAYNENPTMDFHQLVADLLGQKRKDAKHNNFGKLYTMGVPKLARKLGLGCNCGCAPNLQWNKAEHTKECRIHKAFEISKEYDTKFPEAKKLSKEAMDVAKKRGYVRSIMKGRRRYPTGERLHSALNAIIQRTAAETLKVKLLETYNNRKILTIDLRFTVHDELDGDIDPDPKYKQMFKDLLEEPDQRIPCKVPLLWDVETGPNWRVCTE